MPVSTSLRRAAGVAALALVPLALTAAGRDYHRVAGWSPIPEPAGAEWEMSGAAVSPDGRRLVMSHRADPPLLEIDAKSGKILRSWGEGLLVWPHSLYFDRDGFLWVADATVGSGPQAELNPPMASAVRAGRGHQVLKFAPDGRIVMTLGTKGEAGADEAHFNAPTGVAVAKNGDIFVSDGHSGNTNARVVVFSRDGKFLRTFGRKGSGPGEFGEPHAIALDSQERVLVADRSNGRIEVFDREGRFLDQWNTYGRRPSGLAVAADDTLYVSSHDARAHENRITIGRAKDGVVLEVMDDVEDGIEGIAVDKAGTIYATSATGHAAQKLTRH
jgi:DNA-binding beta-propeller fold protein YncE